MNSKSKNIIVIGGGFAGLSTASLLAKQGHKVSLFEKNPQPGGRGHVKEINGFVFDMGPSWYLMPDVFERYFELFNKKPTDFYELKRLDPSYRLFFGNEKIIDIKKDLEQNIKLFDILEPNGGQKLKEYLKDSHRKYEIAMKHFVYKSYETIFDLINKHLIVEAKNLDVFKSIGDYVDKYFTSDMAKKILLYNIVFLGGIPSNTPALYSIMSHIDFELGVWFPKRGMGSIVEALVKLGKENGVEYFFKEPVTGVEIEDSKIKTVKTTKGLYNADMVVNTADYPFFETNILPKQYQTYNQDYWSKKTIAPSGFIAYLGINKKVKGLSHHNLFLDNDWMKHFEAIFNNPSWPDSPSYYVSCPSKDDDHVAPKGHENIFILVPVASGLQDDDSFREKYFDKIITHLEGLLGENLKDHIVHKELFSHKNFTGLYNAYKGTALGLSHTLMQTAIFRPHNKSKKVFNLYYAGQYTNPGIGVPMALISAQVVSDLIAKDL